MVKAFDIETFGVKEVRKFINKANKEAVSAMPKALAKASIFMQGKVKESIAGRAQEPTSVDTGRFLNSIGIHQENRSCTSWHNRLSSGCCS